MCAIPRHFAVTFIVITALAACHDSAVDPVSVAPIPLATFACTVEVGAKEIVCRDERPLPIPGIDAALYGQAQVRLASSNVMYDTTSLLFTADITVQNLLPDLLGTPDGEAVTGIDVFFEDGPRATGYHAPHDSGTVTIENADGRARFTREDQPYFRYNTFLEPGETSGDRTWAWRIPRSVSTFAFTLRVSALTPGELTQPSLQVLISAGVTGSPADGADFRGAGTTVPYAFALSEGYENLTVRLDGRAVGPAGSVTIDSLHLLEASADPVISLSAAHLPILELAKAVGTSQDKVAAFQQYLEAVEALTASIGVAEADSILAIIDYLAIDPDDAFRTELAIDSALAGRTFSLAADGNRGRMMASGSQAGAAPFDSTIFVHINGAYTEQRAASQAARIVEGMVLTSSFSYPITSRTILVYNRTYSAQYDSTALRQIFCSRQYIRQGGTLGPHSRLDRYLTCRGVIAGEWAYGQDYVEALRQIIATAAQSEVAEEDAVVFADTLEALAEQGHKVIVVAHSQGNLMTQQAVRTIRARDFAWESSRPLCIGAVAMGAPLSDGWLVQPEELRGVSIRGDIILGIPELGWSGHNSFPLTYNALSDSLEAGLERLGVRRYVPHFRGPAIAREYLRWGVPAHMPLRSYLGDPRGAAAVRQAMVDVHGALGRRCGPRPVVAPRTASVRVGETVTLGAVLRAPIAGPGLPWQHPFTWTSLDPAIATVDSVGVVTGVRASTRPARIVVARTGVAQTDTATVTVYADGYDGVWAGTWDNGNLFGVPYTTGPMSLAVSGSGGSLMLSYEDGKFDGAVPASVHEDDVPFGRAALFTYESGPVGALTVHGYFHENRGEDTEDPYHLRARLELTANGSRLVGTLTDCRAESTCWFGYRLVGTISLERVP